MSMNHSEPGKRASPRWRSHRPAGSQPATLSLAPFYANSIYNGQPIRPAGSQPAGTLTLRHLSTPTLSLSAVAAATRVKFAGTGPGGPRRRLQPGRGPASEKRVRQRYSDAEASRWEHRLSLGCVALGRRAPGHGLGPGGGTRGPS